MTTNKSVERFGVLMHVIVYVESADCGIDDAIVAIIPGSREDAQVEMARRQMLDIEDDDYIDQYHIVLPIYVNGAVWNSTDPAPDEFWVET